VGAPPVELRCELAACIAVAGSVVAAVGRWRPWLEGQRYPRKRKSCQARGRTPGDPPQVAAEAAAAAGTDAAVVSQCLVRVAAVVAAASVAGSSVLQPGSSLPL